MIYAKATTYGLDTKIKQLQQILQDGLPWFEASGVQDSDIAIYGKIYRNQITEGRIIPEAYISENDYSQVFVNDKIACTIGFLPQGNRIISGRKNTVDIDIICTLNLNSIYGANTRDDEKALIQFKNVLLNGNMIQVINEVKETVPIVFSGFYFEDIKYNDLQPWYIFSLNVTIEYINDYCEPTYGP